MMTGDNCFEMTTLINVQIVILNLFILTAIQSGGIMEKVMPLLLHEDVAATSWWPCTSWWPWPFTAHTSLPSLHGVSVFKALLLTLNLSANFVLWIGLQKKIKFLLVAWTVMAAVNGSIVLVGLYSFVADNLQQPLDVTGMLCNLIVLGTGIMVGVVYSVWLTYVLHLRFAVNEETHNVKLISSPSSSTLYSDSE